MIRPIFALTTLAALCSFAPAQVGVRLAQPPQAVEASSRFDSLFYKAFYLEHGAKKVEEAARLYDEYLKNTQGKGPHVREAATQLAALHERRGDVEGAAALRKAHGLEGAGATPTGRGPVDPAQWLERQNTMIQGLEAQLRELETADPQSPRLERLRQQIERLKAEAARVQAGEAPPQPTRPGRMGMAPGANPAPSLTTMPPAERGPFVEQRAAAAEQMAERLAERNPEMAARMKERAAQMRTLAAQGKWAELDTLFQQAGGMRAEQRGEQPQGRQARPSLADMPAAERTRALEQMLERALVMSNRLRESGNEEAAKQLLETVQKANKLAEEGKWEELDALLGQSLQGARGQRPGGQRPGGQRPGGQRPGGGSGGGSGF